MKRIALFALPVFATIVVFGLGLFLFRTQVISLRPRLTAARGAIADAIEAVTDDTEEAVQ